MMMPIFSAHFGSFLDSSIKWYIYGVVLIVSGIGAGILLQFKEFMFAWIIALIGTVIYYHIVAETDAQKGIGYFFYALGMMVSLSSGLVTRVIVYTWVKSAA